VSILRTSRNRGVAYQPRYFQNADEDHKASPEQLEVDNKILFSSCASLGLVEVNEDSKKNQPPAPLNEEPAPFFSAEHLQTINGEDEDSKKSSNNINVDKDYDHSNKMKINTEGPVEDCGVEERSDASSKEMQQVDTVTEVHEEEEDDCSSTASGALEPLDLHASYYDDHCSSRGEDYQGAAGEGNMIINTNIGIGGVPRFIQCESETQTEIS
ncbi:unnamed protein product, partial [Amoebophrya sp. A25]